jgi:hypothetical protein
MTIIAKHLLQTDDAKRQCLMLLCESISLSQLYIFAISGAKGGYQTQALTIMSQVLYRWPM